MLKPDLLLHKKTLQGNLPNIDTTFTVSGDPSQPPFNFRSLLSYAPWLAGLAAATGWFFDRRSKLKQIREMESENSKQEGQV